MLIQLPARFPLTSIELELDEPSQVIQDSLSGTPQVLSRGPGFWRGTATLAASKRTEEARQLSRFFAQLRKSQHTFRLPLKENSNGTVESGTILSVGSSSLDSLTGVMTIVVTGAGGPSASLADGDYVNINNRLYQITGVGGSAGSYTAIPNVLPNNGQLVLWEDVYVVCRIDTTAGGGGVPVVYNRDFVSPRTFAWVEAING